MYKKIWGLKKLEKMGFPVPKYQVIDITENELSEPRKYLSETIRRLKIPHDTGYAVGVTIRVSMPGHLDKITRHGGLHVTEDNELIERILEKYRQYGPCSKIVVQYTVDARCSGTILKEKDVCIVETVFGDAPALLEGNAISYERWTFLLASRQWRKERTYLVAGKERPVLTVEDVQKFEKYLDLLPSDVYLEWSISKRDDLYFYEYCKLNNQLD
jgi:hypothetical protein